MTIALGTVLVLATWVVWSLILIAAGLLPALGITRTVNAFHILRTSLWWGLLLLAIFANAVGMIWPLASPSVAILGLGLLLTLGALAGFIARRRRLTWSIRSQYRGSLLLVLVTALVTVYFAVAALGPVTNYDSGLYHLGAIRYASEYPAIPGLANLYFPFGYGTAQFPLAALMTNGPWGIEGYRLLNGLILWLAAMDLVLRSMSRRRGPGFFVLTVGLVATWVPMVALSDYWVTSPSQDSAALTLTVVASAYISDAVRGGKNWLGAASTAVAVGTVLTLIRPTLGTYLVGVLVVVLFLIVRRDASLRDIAAPGSWAIGLGLAALVVTTARDRLLSGWVQYPLSVLPFDVPWRVADPTPVREATLGYHRNPDDLWNSMDGWTWVGPWLTERVRHWETYELLALALAAIVLVPIALRRPRRPRLAAQGVLALVPSAVAAAVWWLATPPSYRFAWGVLFTMATIPIGWAMWSMEGKRAPSVVRKALGPGILVSVMTVPVLAVTVYSALFRLDLSANYEPGTVNVGISIPVNFAPVIDAPVSELEIDSGLTLLEPVLSDQCWSNYPLCTPAPQPNLAPLHDAWPDGFTAG